MREKLLDIIKHTDGLGFIEAVKVTGSDESTVFETMDINRTVIVRAELKEAEESLQGEFGMRNLGLLQNLLNHAPYRADTASIKVLSKEHDGVAQPDHVEFTTEGGNDKATFRFMSAKVLPAQASLKQKNWEIDVTPTDSKIQEFTSLANMFNGLEQFFKVTTKDGNLVFQLGDPNGSNHNVSMTFAENVSGEFKANLYWPIQQFLTVLKIGKNDSPKIQFMSLGALQVTLETEHANYSYIIPAHKK